MVLVPYDASKMWLRNHPSVMTIGWTLLERVWEMGQIMTGTGFKLWSVVFIYSKTGRLKLKRGDTAGGFVADCARSALYLLMCVAIGVVVARVLRWMLASCGYLGYDREAFRLGAGEAARAWTTLVDQSITSTCTTWKLFSNHRSSSTFTPERHN